MMIISGTSSSSQASMITPSADAPVSSEMVVSQASAELPFSPRLAYFAFSDFTRHNEWNPHVTSVEYMDASKNEARWTMESYGLKFGWSTVPVRKEPAKLLVWKSVKGLQLECRVEFEPIGENHCRMLYTQCYVPPRKVIKHDRGPSKRESAQLKRTLELFRDAVQKELQNTLR